MHDFGSTQLELLGTASLQTVWILGGPLLCLWCLKQFILTTYTAMADLEIYGVYQHT